jgi:beta-lactamase class A
MVEDAIGELFERAGCRGWLCVLAVDDDREVAVGADELVVAASVFKVTVALEVLARFSDGSLVPTRRLRLTPEARTAGPTGFSLFDDEVEVSARDLVRAMLNISDNVATNALLELVGVASVNVRTAALGLERITLTGKLRALVDSIGRDAGFADWAALGRWSRSGPTAAEREAVAARIRAAAALDPGRTTRTTPREMARLLRMVWRDEAGPADACRTLRDLMGQQLVRNRLARAFPGASVAAKSGGLVGVVTYPDGSRYAMAVFTRSHDAAAPEEPINAAIGAAAALAVDHLRRRNGVRVGPGAPAAEGGA